MADDVQNLSGRVTAAEVEIEAIRRTLEKMDSNMNTLSHTVSTGFDSITKQINASEKTDWRTWLAAGSFTVMVIVAIGTLAAQAPLNALHRIDQTVLRLQAEDRQSLSDRTLHSERIEGLRKTVEGLDITLQREMRLLDSATDERLEALDNRLQREMRDINHSDDVRLEYLEGEVKILRGQ